MQRPGFTKIFKAYGIDFALLSVLNAVGIWLLYQIVLAKSFMWCGYSFCTKVIHTYSERSCLFCGGSKTGRYSFADQTTELGWILTVVVFVVFLCYFGISESGYGKTVGKRFAAVKVVGKNGQKAPFYKIIFAYFFDFVLLFFVSYSISLELGNTLIHVFDLPPYSTLSAWIISSKCAVTGLLLGMLYFMVCESRWGKTLGKKLMGLQIVQDVPAHKTK